MSVVVPSLRAPVLVSLLFGLALAGCLGAEEVEPSGDRAPAGCDDAVLVTIDAAGRLSPDNLTVQQPFALCVTNEGNGTFTYVGMKNKLPKPAFVPPPAVLDPHAEHRGGPPPAVPEFSVEPGKTVILKDIDYSGLIMFMEPTNMDNYVIWEFIPAEARIWAVVENQVILSGAASGDTDAGSTGTYAFDVAVPDLERVQVTVTWDDAADDQEAGQTANREDSFVVRLLDQSGEVVMTREKDGRAGEIKFEYSLDVAAFPEDVTAESIWNASAALEAARPPDFAANGTWTVEIDVVAAPGVAPDEDGSTKGLPLGDGHQAWSAAVTTIHRWASVDVPGFVSSPDIVQAGI